MPIPPDPSPSSGDRSLRDRVQDRVNAATSRLSAAKQRRQKAQHHSVAALPPEIRALLRVFREMGRTQRAARHQIGLPPSPVVREAALAFRRAPTFAGLVLVAASLDEVGLLSW